MKYIFLHFIFLFIHSISKCSCSWLINYTKNIQSSNLTSILCCLSLRIIKIRWYSNNSIFYHGASIPTTGQWISANNTCVLKQYTSKNEMEIIMNSSLSLHNGSFRIKALGCIHCNLSPLRHKICAIVLFRISSNCFIVNEPGVFPFSYQYLSPVLKINRILNILFQVDYIFRQTYFLQNT
ncbi:hypothetical protein ALC56_05926 [Trachymyrmex septentrionalis]|uniref:Ig-like domain-containing protein n=1 Tax=Trachymyrmex septentrionalis TaxID=34720 RepID=A0A195FGA4_9HYME|nr:hypothetical protein ALC56_05926 [Trachymyrmex septentrionalis]